MKKHELPKRNLFCTIMFRAIDHAFVWFAVASDFIEELLWKARTYYLRRADLNWKPFKKIEQRSLVTLENSIED
jgi:hypothetical protein